MELSEVLLKRRSVRRFLEESVSDGDIDALLHAAMSGPSACNKTPWDFYVVSNKEALEGLRGAAHYSNIEAPLAIVVCGDLDKAFKKHPEFWVIDCSIATQNMILAANELGIGSVWLGTWPMEAKMEGQKELFDLPDNLVPHSIVAFGYPDEDPDKSNKPEYEEDKVIFVK